MRNCLALQYEVLCLCERMRESFWVLVILSLLLCVGNFEDTYLHWCYWVNKNVQLTLLPLRKRE